MDKDSLMKTNKRKERFYTLKPLGKRNSRLRTRWRLCKVHDGSGALVQAASVLHPPMLIKTETKPA